MDADDLPAMAAFVKSQPPPGDHSSPVGVGRADAANGVEHGYRLALPGKGDLEVAKTSIIDAIQAQAVLDAIKKLESIKPFGRKLAAEVFVDSGDLAAIDQSSQFTAESNDALIRGHD